MSCLLDGQPDGFIAGFGGYDELFEFVEPLARFEELAYNLVATNEDAACGVGGGIVHRRDGSFCVQSNVIV